MLQAIYQRPRSITLATAEAAEPGSGEVRIDVAYTGVCGTDLHIWHDQHRYWPPVVLGHEYTGRISAVGAGTTGWPVGEYKVYLSINGQVATSVTFTVAK